MKINNAEVLDLIDDLVKRIQTYHQNISAIWEAQLTRMNYVKFNQKSTKVIHLEKRPEYRETMDLYLEFLNDNVKKTLFEKVDEHYRINTRIKNENSVDEKYEDYCKYRPERGEVSLSKCFNDLYGIRLIVDVPELTHCAIQEKLSKYGKRISVEKKEVSENQSGYGYYATHVYFKINNSTFRWELQIWKSDDEYGNMQSHKFHRYKYTKWETEVKNND